MTNSTWSPLSSFCSKFADISNIAFMLSLRDMPDCLGSRDALYLEACLSLNALHDNGEIDDTFFDYLCMHLDYAFRNGGL